MPAKEQGERIELLQGTLDLLILRTQRLEPAHGQAIAKAIEFRSGDLLQVEQSYLYPALQRLIERGGIYVQDSPWENNRPAKFYRLTINGQSRPAHGTSWREPSRRFSSPQNRRADHEPS